MRQRPVGLRRASVVPSIAVLVILAALLATIPTQPASGLGVLPIGGDESVDPADFRITVFASGLDFPYGLIELGDASILVEQARRIDPVLVHR